MFDFCRLWLYAYFRQQLPGGKKSLVAENIFLRQQLAILRRKQGFRKCPRLNNHDKIIFGVLGGLLSKVQLLRSAVIIRPSTVLKLHRLLVNAKYSFIYRSPKGKGYSYYAIRDEILQEELLPEKKAKRLSKSTIECVLNNPFYEGKFFWDGEWYEGKHEPFVPIEWVRKTNGRRGTPNTNTFVGPFSHLMTCAVPGCGCTVIYDPKTKVNKTNGQSRVYHYYHCADGKRLHKETGIRQVNVSENQLWESFLQPIRDLSLNEKMAQIILDHVTEAGKQATESADEVKKRARDRLDEMARKEDELYEHWSSGLLSKDTYTRRLESFKQEREEIERKLAGIENAGDEVVDERVRSLLELCKRAESAWNKGCPEERVGLVKRVCSNFRLEGLTLHYDLKNPFKKLLELKRNTDISKWCPGPDLNWHDSMTRPRILSSAQCFS